jgi:hypothetical protein
LLATTTVRPAADAPSVAECSAAARLVGRERVRLLCGDSFGAELRSEWHCANLLYCPSSCFDADMMRAVATSCLWLPIGAAVITTTQRVPPLDEETQRVEGVLAQAAGAGAGRLVERREELLPYAKGRLTFRTYEVRWSLRHGYISHSTFESIYY